MPELTLTQRAAIATNASHIAKVKSKLKQKANYWKDFTTVQRADVNKEMQKKKRFSQNILMQPNYAENVAPGVGEFFLMQYNTANPVFEGGDSGSNVLADSEYESASFDAAFNYFAGVQVGDNTDIEIDW